MLTLKTIEKRVEEGLARDERWKVIVRGNNWLCPYCLRIGARDLRMDEAIESKIAAHFAQECDRWSYFQVEAEPIESLRQTARLIVFRGRVARWILEDRRFRFATDEERRWLCPYCLELTAVVAPDRALDDAAAWGPAPEEDPFVWGVVAHLLRCATFAEGDDKLRPIRELEEQKARAARRGRVSRARRLFEREAAMKLVGAERRWLCPFCAATQEVALDSDAPGDAFFEAVADHLDVCKAFSVLGGRPRPVEDLRERVAASAHARALARARHKVERHATWRLRDASGWWYCPYCAAPTTVRYPGPDASSDEAFLSAVLEHLGTCEAYHAPNAQVKGRAELARVLQDANEQLERHETARRALTSDAAFGVTDAFSSWVCPYCRRAQKQIHLLSGAAESAVFEKTVEQVVHHLHGDCEAFADGGQPATRAELVEVVRKAELHSSGVREQGAPGAGVRRVASAESHDEESWRRIKEELQEVKTRVERAKRRETSLKEARSKQLRLLPEVPEIPGFELASVYRPCDAVGGDFYDFFRATDECWAFTIGDISGHGIEAALLMGLAKKLLEVRGRGRTSTSQTLSLANRDIFTDLDERTFVTVLYGLLDTATRRFKFSRAGHDPIVLYNEARLPRLCVLDSKGMALGMDEGPVFEQTIEELEVDLVPGDLLLSYTDGVTEAMNEQAEQFGRERLFAVLEECGRHEAEYVLWRIERAVAAFQGKHPQTDDLTMIACRVL